MKDILNKLFEHQNLTRAEASDVLTRISESAYTDAQVAAFITVFLMRGVTVDELAGFRDALLNLCTAVDVGGRPCIDLCGTGGDGKNTFNISTTASFVVAAAGYAVVKHGNYGVSSPCGSSNVMTELGYTFPTKGADAARQLDKTNYCFLHAPLFHPALKAVSPIRKSLGVKTFFNMLGPLVNPARPSCQLVGVFNLRLSRLYQHLYEGSDIGYCIVHSLDGYDEISLTSPARVVTPTGVELASPDDFGQSLLTPDQLNGMPTIAESSQTVVNILSGNGSPAQESVVLANAALAIRCFNPKASFQHCFEQARETIRDGRAIRKLQSCISFSQSA